MFTSDYISGMLPKIVLVSGVFFLALVLGLVPTLGNSMVVIFTVGLMVTPILLINPKFMIWVLLLLGLVSGFVISILLHGVGGINWIMPGLSIMLLIPSVLTLLWQKKVTYPIFLWLLIAFILYSLVITVANWHGFFSLISGFKHYFQMHGLLFALAILTIFTLKNFQQWKNALFVIALFQLPAALYEFLILVPLRGGLGGIASTDVVAGTFGANLEGGSPNSTMALFLIIVFIFTVSYYKNGLVSFKKLLLISTICLTPIFLAEVKIALFLIPLSALFLYRKELIFSPVRTLPIIFLVGLFTLALGYFYIHVILDSNLMDVIEGTLKYNVGDQGYSKAQYLNRISSITFWFDQSIGSPIHMIFGNGLGSSYSSSTNVGHIAKLYPDSGINLTTVSTLLWDVGLFGITLFLMVFYFTWRAAGKLLTAGLSQSIKADIQAVQVAIFLILIMTLHSDALVNLYQHQIIFSFIFGYLVFLYRTNNRFKTIDNGSEAEGQSGEK